MMTGMPRLTAVAAFCMTAIACLAANRLNASIVKLAWDPNPETDIACYRVHCGIRPGNYETTLETNETTVAVSDLVKGRAYYFMVQAINSRGLASAPSNEISYLVPSQPIPMPAGTVFPDGLPLPWSHMDIGAVNPDATASFTSGVFTIRGFGTLEDVEDTTRFVWRTLSGSGEISARINVLENATDSSRIGVMIRDSLAANSKHVFFGVDGGGRYQWVHRRTPGGQPYSVSRNGGRLTNLWFRLKRSGHKITAYKSENGRNWKQVWKVTRKNVSFGTTCYVGFSVSSGSDAPCTAAFSDVIVMP